MELAKAGSMVFCCVDRTKIEANANKYSFVWKKSITKYETHLLAKLDRKIPQLCKQ